MTASPRTPSPRTLSVDAADAGVRLDVFLAAKLDLSRAQARRLLARGAVRLSGREVSDSAKGERLVAGATVLVEPFTREGDERAVAEPTRPLAMLAEGPGWIALDKPAGVPVHPLRPGETGTLLNGLIAQREVVHGIGEGGLRSGVVHRLDVDTSGAVLFATREDVWQRLRTAFREHRVEKVYRAIVVGTPPEDGEVEVGLLVARHRPARVRVVRDGEHARGVRWAHTSFRRLESFGPAALLEVRPTSGHLHQIRVTLAHLGFPVAGDPVYGAGVDPTGAPREMLHAARVAFEEVAAESPDPEDFAATLSNLRKLRAPAVASPP